MYQDVDELYLMLAEDNKVSIYFWPPNVKDTPMKLNAIVRLRNLEDIKEIKFGEDFAFLVSDGDIVAFNWLDAIYSASQHD